MKRTAFGRKHIKIRKMVLKLWVLFWFWLGLYLFFPAILFLCFLMVLYCGGEGRVEHSIMLRVKTIHCNF